MRNAAALVIALSLGSGAAGAATPASQPPLAGPAAATAATPTGAPSPTELVQRIDAAQKDLRSLTADFVQKSRVKLFKQEVRSEGRLLFRAASTAGPASLRWEYLRPDPSTLVMRGDLATLRMGGRPPQVFDTGKDANMRAIFAQLRLWLGQGTLADAQAEYELSSAGTPAQPTLVLVPRVGSPLRKHFARIEMHCDGRTLQLDKLVLTEASGDEKEIAFLKVQRNAKIPSDAFD